jgi:hypothetical protein
MTTPANKKTDSDIVISAASTKALVAIGEAKA